MSFGVDRLEPVFVSMELTDAATAFDDTPTGADAGSENLLTDDRSEFWRTQGDVTLAVCRIDLGGPRLIEHVALLDVHVPGVFFTTLPVVEVLVGNDGTNFTTWRSATRSLAADGGAHVVFTRASGDAAVTNRWLQIQMSFGGSAAQIGASRLVVGGGYSPPFGISMGSGLVTPSSDAEIEATEVGTDVVRHLTYRRVAEPAIIVPKSDYDADFWGLLGFSGRRRPILYVQDYDTDVNGLDSSDLADSLILNQQLVYGRQSGDSPIAATFAKHYEYTVELRETR